jgi:hypothetical protein
LITVFLFHFIFFKTDKLAPNWLLFLDDFQRHWPTDDENTYVDFGRDNIRGAGTYMEGKPRWRRFAEKRTGSAKLVFHFDVPGTVAKSTHEGLPWFHHLHQHLGNGVHFWPYDGWIIPVGRSSVAEVYPALCSHSFERNENRTSDQHDTFSIADWMRQADLDGRLEDYFKPSLNPKEQRVAKSRAGF